MTRREIQSILDDTGVRPSRQLGQNFLCDDNIARWIAGQLKAGRDDTVIEVGPGTGALTAHLAGKFKRLVLIEKDRRLAEYLRHAFPGPEIEVLADDAAAIDIRPWFAAGPVTLIGNLPYSAGGEIIRNFLRQPTPVRMAVLMLQQEVAQRLCAEPGTKDYGVLTVRVQSDWLPSLIKTVPSAVFHPRPQVASAVVRLEPRPDGASDCYDRALFDSLVRRGFSQRRKQLKKLLPVDNAQWQEIAAMLQVPGSARAEEIGLAGWIALTNALEDHPLKGIDEADRGADLFDVVDEDDAVIGQAPRAEVHERGLRHRAVHIFIFNRKGELFLQKRSRLKDRHPCLWDSSAAGHLDAGEEYETAARRELEEELGISAELRFCARIPACEETGWEFVHLYAGQHDGPMRLNPREIDCGAFFSIEMAEQWLGARPQDFAPGYVECFRRFREAEAATNLGGSSGDAGCGI